MYFKSNNTCAWGAGRLSTTVIQVSSAILQVNGTIVSTSDRRFNFNDKPLANAYDVINKLELVAYDQAYELADQYTVGTPQSHQCGIISQ